MIFWYEVITSKDIDIDFDRIYTFVSEELENSGKNNDLEDIYNEFVDNVCYYVRSVVGDCEDLEEDDFEEEDDLEEDLEEEDDEPEDPELFEIYCFAT